MRRIAASINRLVLKERFEMWSLFVVEEAMARERDEHYARVAANLKLGRCLRRWRSFREAELRRAQLATVAVESSRRRLLARVSRAWAAWATDRFVVRRIGARVQRSQARRVAASTLAGWRRVAYARGERCASLEDAAERAESAKGGGGSALALYLRRRRRMRSVAAWHSWRRAVGAAAQCEEAARAAWRGRKQALCRAVVGAWRGGCRVSRERREAAAKRAVARMGASTRVALGAWREHAARTKRVRRAVLLLRGRSAAACRRAAWAAWGAHCRRVRALAVASGRITTRGRAAALRRAWCAWVEAKRAARAAADALRRCVQRKRITQEWFMDWYWKCFDDEAGAAMRELMTIVQTPRGGLSRTPGLYGAPVSGGSFTRERAPSVDNEVDEVFASPRGTSFDL